MSNLKNNCGCDGEFTCPAHTYKNNPSPTTMKECNCVCHMRVTENGEDYSNVDYAKCSHCKPSEEKECICTNDMGTTMRGDCPLYEEHEKIDVAPKQEEWEELKDILKINILEVSYTQSQENFIDDIKSFISQLLKKEREKVIEEVKKNTKDLTKYETEFTCPCGQEHSVQFLIRKPKVMKGKITEITINSQQLKK